MRAGGAQGAATAGAIVDICPVERRERLPITADVVPEKRVVDGISMRLVAVYM
jgi:hypothetical protein